MKDKNIEQIIRETTEENQSKTDWTKAWSTKYPILKTYQAEADIPHYARQIRAMFIELQNAMLVLKDKYMDKEGQMKAPRTCNLVAFL